MSQLESNPAATLIENPTLTVSPNPAPWDSSVVSVEWTASKESCVQLCIAKQSEPEQLVAQEDAGQMSIDWLQRGMNYYFRLYATNPERHLLSQVLVEREGVPWDMLREESSLSVSPNPLPWDSSLVTVEWTASIDCCVELCVGKNGEPEQVVTRQDAGQLSIDWLRRNATYYFRLYATDPERHLLSQVLVERDGVPWDTLRAESSLSVSPNPLPWDSSLVTAEWTASKDCYVELCVAKNSEPEQVVAQKNAGQVSIDWLRRNATYYFRLYVIHPERQLLSEVVVEREPLPWARLGEEVADESLEDTDQSPAVDLVAKLTRRLLHSRHSKAYFRSWQKEQVHITPVHFYQPIPETETLPESCWAKKELAGIDLRTEAQLNLLRNVFPRYAHEYGSFPLRRESPEDPFHLENGLFEGLDSLVAYNFVRHFRPRRIIEIGGGYSTLILAKAALANGDTSLVTVEPYPVDFLRAGVPGLTRLYETKVESLPFSSFSELGCNDILFIDSSHVVKIGGDVNYLFLEVLPRLAPGTIVHIHDINFPFDYPKEWVLERLRFWTEQYILQAFLLHNSEFQVLLSNQYVSQYHFREVREAFPSLRSFQGGSFWMQRRTSLVQRLAHKAARLFPSLDRGKATSDLFVPLPRPET